MPSRARHVVYAGVVPVLRRKVASDRAARLGKYGRRRGHRDGETRSLYGCRGADPGHTMALDVCEAALWVIGAVAATVLVGCGIGSPGPLHPATDRARPYHSDPITVSSAIFASGWAACDRAELGHFFRSFKPGHPSPARLILRYDPSGSSHVDQGTNTVSGFVQGAAVQLTIGSSTYTGSLETDGSLNLSVTQSDGSISVEHFTPANISDYNAAIAPLQTMVEQWNTAYWGTQAAKSCILTVPGSYDVRVFVGEGGAQICSAAVSLSYSLTTTYVSSDGVLCIGTEGGVIVAVTDDGGATWERPYALMSMRVLSRPLQHRYWNPR